MCKRPLREALGKRETSPSRSEKRPPREATNVPFAKPKHPKAGRGKRSDPQGVTARRGEVPQCAKKTVGAAGLPPLAGEMSEGQRGHKAISTTYNPSPSMGEGQGEGDRTTFANQRR